MYLGRVAGCVWATAKDPSLEGQRLLIIQPLTPALKDRGKSVLCTDCTGAGAGEIVYWTRGKEASFPFLPKEVPTDMTVVGIVDSVNCAADGAGPPASGSAGSSASVGANPPASASAGPLAAGIAGDLVTGSMLPTTSKRRQTKC